jgi:hypothetical protein
LPFFSPDKELTQSGKGGKGAKKKALLLYPLRLCSLRAFASKINADDANFSKYRYVK